MSTRLEVTGAAIVFAAGLVSESVSAAGSASAERGFDHDVPVRRRKAAIVARIANCMREAGRMFIDDCDLRRVCGEPGGELSGESRLPAAVVEIRPWLWADSFERVHSPLGAK